MGKRKPVECLPLDPKEMAFLARLADDVSSGTRVASIRKPSDRSVSLLDERTGEIDDIGFVDNPFNRVMFAIKQYCGGDTQKFMSAMLRLWAFADIVNWLKATGTIPDLNDTRFAELFDWAVEISAGMPLNSRLLFSKREFRRQLARLAKSGGQSQIRLPKAVHAVVGERKMTHYLLSEVHPRGREKAAFFLRRGFRATEWRVLASALVSHARIADIAAREVTAYGIKYIIEGPLRAPDGSQPTIRTIWSIAQEGDPPQFVTAYPLRRGRTK
jgi:hypothetical protein